MTNSLGSRIKGLRKARGITQEQLADAIGVSFQAVSKWENDIALPDITLVPALASYFGVSTDTLFDFNLREMNEKVLTLCRQAAQYRENDPAKCRAMLEEGLKQYPDNDVLLNNLLYAVDSPDEIIAIASRLIENTKQDDVKYDALRCLSSAYREKGDMASAVAAIEQIPEIYFTKLSEMALLLSGKSSYEAAEKQKWLSFETLLQMMGQMARYYETEGDRGAALSEAERALRLISAFSDEPKIGCFDPYAVEIKGMIDRLK